MNYITKASGIFVQRIDDEKNTSNVIQKDKINEMIWNIIQNLKNFKNEHISVFISSSKVDLVVEREAISELINRMGFDLISMEDFGARTENPLDVCLSELDSTNIYLCILGMRYGTLYKNKNDEKRNRLSYTEIEYDYIFDLKEKKGTRILIYCIDETNAKLPPIYVDKNNLANKLKRFKEKVKQNHVIYEYRDLVSLLSQIAHDLHREGMSIIKKREDNSVYPIDTNEASISISAEDEITYLYRPMRIFGKTTGLKSSRIFLYLTENTSEFPPKDDEIIQLDEADKLYISLPLSNDGCWTHNLDLTNLSERLRNDTYSLLVTSSSKLSETNIVHTSCPLTVKKGYLSISSNASVVFPGEVFSIKGIAQTRCPYVYLWLCSENKIYGYVQIEIRNYEYTYQFPNELLEKLTPGTQCFVVLDMPITDTQGDVWLEQNDGADYLCSKNKQIFLKNNGIKNISTKIREMLLEQNGLQAYFSFVYAEPKIIQSNKSNGRNLITHKSNVITLEKETNLPNGTLILAELFYKNPLKMDVNPYELVASLTEHTSGSLLKSSFSISFNLRTLSLGEYKVQIRLASKNKILLEEYWRKE